MDMKKILQAMDGAAQSAPKADDDMKRFVSIIAEGRGPLNRLTQAENIAVNHYSDNTISEVSEKKTSTIDKYFKSVEQEIAENRSKKLDNAKALAERVSEQMLYGKNRTINKNLSRAKNPPDNINQMAKHGASSQLQREQYTYRDIAELARQGLSDEDIAERLGFDVNEGLKDPKDNPCWKGYHPVGTKKKGGRTVPNCVPKK
jgi:hypothetical protein